MDFLSHDSRTSATVNASCFRGGGGVDEYNLVIQPGEAGSIEDQLCELDTAYRHTLTAFELPMQTAVLRRFFCSDVHNQAGALNACSISRPADPDEPCAVSWIGQAPAWPAKVMLWAYHVRDSNGDLKKSCSANTLTIARGDLAHHWTTGLTCTQATTSHDQTRGIFHAYDAVLGQRSLRLADHVIRTWLFVKDIDADYSGLVAARREFFATRGLTADTHFIASSGIQGGAADVAAKVVLDAYAISNVEPRQIRFLSAPDHLSPTHIYGVTFERGTSVDYRDRRHIFISGTASIDAEGKILHHGDVLRQLDRTLDNVQALLRQAGAALADMSHFIVYVRDPADHAVAHRLMRERFGRAPIAVITAPVCRPGWLIEVEGIAVIPASNPDLPSF